MKSKTVGLILLALCMLTIVTPVAQAAPFDWWYKQSAYTGLMNERPGLKSLDSSEWSIRVTSNLHPPHYGAAWYHKHVVISYDCEDYTLYWTGRVLTCKFGKIETLEYEYTVKIVPEPTSVHLKTRFVVYGPIWWWDGGQWKYDDPVCYRSDTTGKVLIEGEGFSRTTNIIKGWCLAVYLPLDVPKDTITFTMVS